MARLFAAILALLALMAPATAENVPPFLTQYEIAVEGSPKFRGSLTIAHVVECQGQSTSRHYLLEDRHMGDRVVIVGEVTDSTVHDRRTVTKEVTVDRETTVSGVPTNIVFFIRQTGEAPASLTELHPADELRNMITAFSPSAARDVEALLPVVKTLENEVPQLLSIKDGGRTIRFTLIDSKVYPAPTCR